MVAATANDQPMSKCVRMYIGQRLLILFFKFVYVIYCPPVNILMVSRLWPDAWWLCRARCVRNHYHFTDSSILPNFNQFWAKATTLRTMMVMRWTKYACLKCASLVAAVATVNSIFMLFDIQLFSLSIYFHFTRMLTVSVCWTAFGQFVKKKKKKRHSVWTLAIWFRSSFFITTFFFPSIYDHVQ